jgi:myo-inositol-1(or 4)-monophosphatase
MAWSAQERRPSMQAAVEAIAREAGVLALDHFNRLAATQVEAKGHLDLVTAADRAVERLIVSRLGELFPDDGIQGEEGAAVQGTSGRTWVIDPIDGTFNFVRGGDQWAVSIGLREEGVPSFGVVHAPVRRQLAAGGRTVPATLNGTKLAPRHGLERNRAAASVSWHPAIAVEDRLRTLAFVMGDLGMACRHGGSSVTALLDVALGLTDGHIGMGEAAWDVMAGLAILAPLGVGSTIDWPAATPSTRFRFACGTPAFLNAVAPLLASDHWQRPLDLN